MCAPHDATATHEEVARLLNRRGFLRTQQVDEYIVERDDAGTPPRTPTQALDTARVGYEYLRTVQF